MKISIITATYNSAKTIACTMESVLKQDYDDYEYLLIDGYSKDNTMEVVKEYETRFKGRMRWISEPDKGMYDAMNKGVAMATGEVVGILNSDDFYSSTDILSSIAEAFLNDDKLDAVYGNIHFVKDGNLDKPTRYYSSRLFRRGWMRFGFIPAHPSFYCKKSAYEECKTINNDTRSMPNVYFDTSYKIAADFENLIRLIYVLRIKTKYIKKDFVTMRTGGASTSGMRSHKQIMRDHKKALKTNKIYSNYLMLCIRYIYKIGELGISKFRKR